ncbi:hypothetical protein B0I37DRAFT_435791 [Chaetomium sp. MPI-CAGE-AT-0009]|nr:hypothetical protein B0I37DRAFT_435791 [Chaetomium sp. MPI-CAGE-AT-0009]
MAPLPLSTHTVFQTLTTTLHPTRTLHPRQSQTTNPDGSTITIITGTITAQPLPSWHPTDATTLSGGAIAGIVLGSIAGFLLLLWIIRSCCNLGAPPGGEEGEESGEESQSESQSQSQWESEWESDGYGEYETVVPVQEVKPVVVREGRRSRSRGYYGYAEETVARSRSRGKYY